MKGFSVFPLYIPSSKALSGKSPVISESGLLSCLLKEMLVSRTVKLRLLLLWVFFEFLPKNDNCMVIDDLRVPQIMVGKSVLTTRDWIPESSPLCSRLRSWRIGGC